MVFSLFVAYHGDTGTVKNNVRKCMYLNISEIYNGYSKNNYVTSVNNERQLLELKIAYRGIFEKDKPSVYYRSVTLILS